MPVRKERRKKESHPCRTEAAALEVRQTGYGFTERFTDNILQTFLLLQP